VSDDARLHEVVESYAGPRGNLGFPLDRPIPHAPIGRIVRDRLK
jgi:hypothetical protein